LGVDPTLDGDDLVLAAAGGSVVLPIRVTDSLVQSGNGVLGFSVGGFYDTTKLDLTTADISLGGFLTSEVPTGNWGISAVNVDEGAGTFVVTVIRTNGQPTTLTGPGVVLNVEFDVKSSAPSGVVPVTLTGPATTGGGSTPAFSWTYANGSVLIDAVGPQVSDVFWDSTDWSADFRDYVDGTLGDGNARGYRVPKGSGQLTTLPWVNVNQLKVKFDDDVSASLQASDVTLAPAAGYTGFNSTGLASLPTITSLVNYDTLTNIATFSLSHSLESTAFDVVINAAGVTDLAGNQLDGEWSDGVTSGDSGNGTPGGNFSFRQFSLPGDARDESNLVVNAIDQQDVRDDQNGFILGVSVIGPYDSRTDLDGNGVVDSIDQQSARDTQNAFILPPMMVAALSSAFSPSSVSANLIASDGDSSSAVARDNAIADAAAAAAWFTSNSQHPAATARRVERPSAETDEAFEHLAARPDWHGASAWELSTSGGVEAGDEGTGEAVDQVFESLDGELALCGLGEIG
jgi:hypothetical protein